MRRYFLQEKRASLLVSQVLSNIAYMYSSYIHISVHLWSLRLFIWEGLGISKQYFQHTGRYLSNKYHDNKFALLWGEAQLCLPYGCL